MVDREYREYSGLSIIGAALAMAFGPAAAGQQPASPIKPDEVVVFYPTFARQDADDRSWRVSIHGSIVEPEARSLKRALLVKVFREMLPGQLSREEREIFDRRVRLLLVDGERGKTIPIRLGPALVEVGPSGGDGHFRGEIRLTQDEMDSWFGGRQPAEGWASLSAVLPPRDHRAFEGRIVAMTSGGLSVISDIDDTIKVTNVRQRKELLANSFVRPFRAVPGMAEAYRAMAEGKATFHYVSASPWQFYPALAEFVRDARFPAGTFHLKSVRFTDSSVGNLFGSQQEYKTGEIEAILKAFPRRRFVLVGDSGEQDPEIYGNLARKYPDQVGAVWIRNVTEESADNSRCRAAFAEVASSRWLVFREPTELRERAQQILKLHGQSSQKRSERK